MKSQHRKIGPYAYWVSTSLLVLLYLGGAGFYFYDTEGARQAFTAVGYPPYLVPLLGTAKLLGVIAIVWRVNTMLSDLAYAGMFFHLLLAISAHLYGGGSYAPAALGLLALFVSFGTQNTVRDKKSPYAAALNEKSYSGAH